MAKKPILIPDTSSDSSSGDDNGYIWAQCEYENCQKWRKLNKEAFLKEGKQAQKWYCELNPDIQCNDCSKPEENWEVEAYKYNQKLKLYTIIHAKHRTYTKWPAIITLCPVKNKYTDRKNSIYHVEFFGISHSHAWVDAYNIEIIGSQTELQIPRAHKQYSRVKVAFEEAKEAMIVQLNDRSKLIKFKFVVASEAKNEEVNKPNKSKINRNNEYVSNSNHTSPCDRIANQEVFTDFSELHLFGISLLDQMQIMLTRFNYSAPD
ncbi:Zinc finger CW-type PWWP domain protein 1 [Oopsacas minuta]|uniref:Zinc finger CW-type PWWP domain protein 1 n=1 Tax=Oopsacas minuta TaxID=111878 RepID=A0AAV7KIM9_9METZ|nr:Zinc finger CW-type PWWP domain protein 1 [Oopsacas minuta]